MPNWIIPDGPACRIGVLLFERFSNHCLANTLEPFRAANRFLGRRAYDWEVLTLDGAPVTSSSGLPVAPGRRLGQAAGGELLVLLPSYGFRAWATPGTARALRAAAGRWGALAGLDTGSWLLAEAGLLDGRRATIHFDEFDAFAERFPEVTACRERWVVDGDRITAGGAMTAFELVLHLIGLAHGTALTVEIAALFMMPGAGVEGLPAPARADRRVARALAAMQAHAEAPLTVGALARAAGCGQKELERRFRAALGAPPRTVYRRLRLGLGRRLAEEGAMGVAEIATRCGYADPAAFTRAFRAEFGTTPRALRP